MNGQPRINPGFLVGHHEFHAFEERRARREELRIEKNLLLIAKLVKRGKRRGKK